LRYKERIVIIGNGVSGNTAMEVMQRYKPSSEVAMISEEPYPEYSPCVLPHYISGDIKRKKVFLKSFKDYYGVKIRFGDRVKEIDSKRNRLLFDKGYMTYDKLILATGGRPAVPPIEGIDSKGVSYLKTLTHAERLLRLRLARIGIIGTGLIGVETAVALRKRGHKVILIGRRRWILPRILDEGVSWRVQKLLEKKGIRIITGDRVKEIIHNGKRVEGIRTEERKISCDWVIIAAGIEPRVELAKDGGLEIGPLGGIKVNERMETSQPNIYACGDCAEPVDPETRKSGLQLRWFNARQMGHVAGLNSIGIRRSYLSTKVGWIFDIFGISVGSIGELSQNLSEERLEIKEEECEGLYGRFLIKDDRIIGFQFIGRVDELGIIFSAISSRYSIKRIREQIISFPWYHKLRRFV